MPYPLTKPDEVRNVPVAISHRENAEEAIKTFQDLVTQLDHEQAKDMFIKLIVGRGFTESQILPRIVLHSAPVESRLDQSKA
jgi:hypothetical protein